MSHSRTEMSNVPLNMSANVVPLSSTFASFNDPNSPMPNANAFFLPHPLCCPTKRLGCLSQIKCLQSHEAKHHFRLLVTIASKPHCFSSSTGEQSKYFSSKD